MDLKKSIKIALAKKGENTIWLANKLGVSPRTVTEWMKVGRINTDQVQDISRVCGMKSSEFIALGED